MVAELKKNGSLQSPEVEAAFLKVPRHLFVPGIPPEQAYEDRAIVIKEADGQYISSSSQPSIMAIMLEQLDLQPGQKVLEIGAGTGYNAALIASIVGPTGQVVTVDIDEDLVHAARQHLDEAGFERAQAICADGGYGYAPGAPYDRIILTVAAYDIAPAWREQLKDGGRLVLPLEIALGQRSIAFERSGVELISRSAVECGFISLRGAFANPDRVRLPLGPQDGLFLDIRGNYVPDPARLYDLLSKPSQDWDTGIEIRAGELFAGLLLWLGLHEQGIGELVAQGGLAEGRPAESSLVPPLVGIGGERKTTLTVVLIGEDSLAAFTRPLGQTISYEDPNTIFSSDQPFRLTVRQFGLQEAPARRLIELSKNWDQAGRPSSAGLRIRSLPKDSEYQPVEGEYEVEKPWSRLVLDWKGK